MILQIAPGRRWRTLAIPFALGLATFLCGLRAATDQDPSKDEPAKQVESRLSKSRSIVEPLLVRADFVRGLEEELGVLKIAAARAAVAEKQARQAVAIAKIARSEYLSVKSPVSVRDAEEKRALALAEEEPPRDRKQWADRMLKKGSISENEHMGEAIALQKSETATKQAEATRQFLEKYTVRKEAMELAARIKEAEETLAKEKEIADAARAKLPVLEQRIQDESLTPGETRVLVLLDEAEQLADAGQAASSRARLEDADRLWQTEQARRAEQRYKNLLKRIQETIDSGRGPTTPKTHASGEAATHKEPRRNKVQTIAEPLLEHGEKVRELVERLGSLQESLHLAGLRLDAARSSLEAAKNARRMYTDGVLPSEFQQAKGELDLALSDQARAQDRKDWAEKMLKQQLISENLYKADAHMLERANLAAASAKTRFDAIAKSGNVLEIARLDGEIEVAEAVVAENGANAAVARLRVSALENQISERLLSPAQMRVLATLLDVAWLDDVGQSAPAQAKLDEATRLWDFEQTHRPELEHRSLMDRVHKRITEGNKTRGLVEAVRSEF